MLYIEDIERFRSLNSIDKRFAKVILRNLVLGGDVVVYKIIMRHMIVIHNEIGFSGSCIETRKIYKLTNMELVDRSVFH